MASVGKKGVDKAFAMLKTLPRVCLANLRNSIGAPKRVSCILMYLVITVTNESKLTNFHKQIALVLIHYL